MLIMVVVIDFRSKNRHTNKTMLIPLNKNIIEIDTSNTTQFDGEFNFYIEVKIYEKN